MLIVVKKGIVDNFKKDDFTKGQISDKRLMVDKLSHIL